MGAEQIPQLLHLLADVLPVEGLDGQGRLCLLLVLYQFGAGRVVQAVGGGSLSVHVDVPTPQTVFCNGLVVLRRAGDGVVAGLLEDPPAVLDGLGTVGSHTVHKVRAAFLIQHEVQHVHAVFDALARLGYVLRLQVVVVKEEPLRSGVVGQPELQVGVILFQQIGVQDAP